MGKICKENSKEYGSIGGKKSGEVRREKKSMKDALCLMLDMPLKRGKEYDVEDIKSFADLKGKNISVQQALLIVQVQKALKGDTSAMTFIRDTSGQKEPDEVQVTTIELPKFEGEDELE